MACGVSWFVRDGVDGHAEGSAKFAEMIAEEIPVWAEAVEIAGVKLK